MSTVPRWFTDTDEGHSQWYVERFRALASEGEARLIDAMAAPGSRVLDAGCGPGRTSGALSRRGHDVVGADVDPVLVDAARADHPGPRYVVADLATLDLPGSGIPEPFDAAVCAGNVLAFVASGTETTVLTRIRAHLRPDAFLAVGFHVDRYELDAFDRHAREAGFMIESRFATWDVRPWHPQADFAVTILRNPAEGNPA